MKRLILELLKWLLIGALCLGTAACQSQSLPSGTAEPTEQPAQTLVQNVPDNGKADTSNLPNLDAIAAYQKDDWSAVWIWTESCSDDSYVAFRKTFTLDAVPEKAQAYISAADKYELWVNGELIVLDGSLKRGATPVDSYYDTVQIPNLTAGENTVALLVAFNGRSGDGSIVPVAVNEEGDEYNQAGLLFELHAGSTVIASDATWKVQRHNAYKNRVTGGTAYVRYEQSSMLAERNVFYMAADSIGDFMAKDYDDSGWADATPIAKAGDLPFGSLYAGITETPKFGELTDFENASEYTGKALTADTVLELRLPGNIQFTWEIELESEAGKHLTFYTDTHTDRQDAQNFKDTYITASGAQSYENYPWRSGSKLYIEAEAGVTFTRIAYRPSGFNGEWAGGFSSSDEALNQLWQESLNTITICMRDAFMDCPDRERGPYMGDASNQMDAALYSFDQGGLDLIKRSILACVAWTTDSGVIPSRAPSAKPQEIPNQSLAVMSSAYHYWMHSGDADTMTAYYKAFVNYLKLYEMGEDGLPKYRAGSWQWNDWGEKIDTELLQTGFYFYALRLTRQLADDLGINTDNAFLDERIASIRENWRAAFEKEDGFHSNASKYVDDRANALLALSGLAEEKDYERIISVLTGTYEASPFTEKYLLEALCIMGREDLAVERIKYRYDPMLHDEWDTLWELFNDRTGTYNHGWSSAPLYILSKYVAGIRPVKPGWEEYEIVVSDAVENVTCSVWTIKGTVTVEKTGGKITVTAIDAPGTVTLPDGSTFRIEGAGTYTFGE